MLVEGNRETVFVLLMLGALLCCGLATFGVNWGRITQVGFVAAGLMLFMAAILI